MKLLLVVLVLFAVACSSAGIEVQSTAPDPTPSQDTTPPDAARVEPVELSISALNDVDLPPGRYVTSGFLAYPDRCGYCPEGVACEPCAETLSILSERDDVQFAVEDAGQPLSAELTPSELLLDINLDGEGELRLGARYEMTIELTDWVPRDHDHRVARVLAFRDAP